MEEKDADKTITEKDEKVSISVDVEDIENRVRSELKKEQEKEQANQEEAERIAYLKSIKIEDFQDKTDQLIIKEMLESNLNRKDKVETIRKLVAKANIADCLRRAEALDEEDLNHFALKKLKELNQKGKNLSQDELTSFEGYLGTLESDFLRIGRQNLQNGLENEVNVESLSGAERLNFELKKKLQEMR